MPRRAASEEPDDRRTLVASLVRNKREALHMTMDDLAAASRVSRSTLHRIEHSHATRPTAPKLAQILAVLGITPEQVTEALDDERYLGDVLHWMARSSAFVDVANGLRPRPALARLAGEDSGLVVIKDDHTAQIHGSGLDEIGDALEAAGWAVAVLRPR